MRLLTEEEYYDFLSSMMTIDDNQNPEYAHIYADDLLTDMLRLMGYTEIVDAYDGITKWYA